jgi:hypothetical protein
MAKVRFANSAYDANGKHAFIFVSFLASMSAFEPSKEFVIFCFREVIIATTGSMWLSYFPV